MKKLLALAVLMLGLIATTDHALAQGKQDFTLVNRTGYTIDQVFVTPHSAKDWGSDVMGRDVLYNGEYVHINFSRKEKTCMWDLLVIFDDGEEAEWERFDLCKTSRISLSYDRKRGVTWADYE